MTHKKVINFLIHRYKEVNLIDKLLTGKTGCKLTD